MDNIFNGLQDLDIYAEQAEIVYWGGREALRLENGLALIPGSMLRDASIEVLIGTDGPAYPGVAFRLADVLNYELAYAVPHVSGEWDAIQYDPIFHGSNTWQLYHGSSYQQIAQIPTGRWFRLRVDFYGSRAAIAVDNQPPLVVEQLAHGELEGRCGLWTFRPAYFCDLRISACEALEVPSGVLPRAAEKLIEAWLLQDYGVVTCEPNGIVNLNRYLPILKETVRLTRRFELLKSGELTFEFGFSDVLSLELDGKLIFKGENTFKGFADRDARGYAELGNQSVQQGLAAGEHRITVELLASEPFGWGLILAMQGKEVRWLPAELG